MKSEHGYIFEQMRRDSIDEALAYYNMGDLGSRETVFLIAFISAWTGSSMVNCEVFRCGRTKRCEFLQTAIEMERTSSVTALIEVPKIFVRVYRLAAFVLDDREVERHRKNAEMFNAAYLPPEARKPVESIGGIRI